MKPGPKPQPWRTLADAAILFAASLEAGDRGAELARAKARLRSAARRYRRDPKPLGRPAGVTA